MSKQLLGTKEDAIKSSLKNLENYQNKNTIVEYWETDGVSKIEFIAELPYHSYNNVTYIINAKLNISNNILTITGDEIKFDEHIYWIEPSAKIDGENIYFKYKNKQYLEEVLSKYKDDEYEIIERWARIGLFKKQKVYSVKFKRVKPLLNKTYEILIKANNWAIYGRTDNG